MLGLAALYNVSWGIAVVAAPGWCLDLLQLDAAVNRPLVQCIGMLVGVYGLAYGIASHDPVRYWPLVFVGFIGKILGPIGAVWAIHRGELPTEILYVNLANDVIWWLPFAWILASVRRGAIPTAQGAPDAGKSLYESLLGPKFHDLDSQLRRFHSAREPIEVRGRFAVVRPAGALRNWIADREGFPRASDAISVHLRVEPRGRKERWIRKFADTALVSTQWRSNGLLAERLGFVTLYMSVDVVDRSLLIRSVRSTAFGVPLPPVISPRVLATGQDTPQGVRIRVVLQLAPLGPLVEYGGVVSIVVPPEAGPSAAQQGTASERLPLR